MPRLAPALALGHFGDMRRTRGLGALQVRFVFTLALCVIADSNR